MNFHMNCMIVGKNVVFGIKKQRNIEMHVRLILQLHSTERERESESKIDLISSIFICSMCSI